MTPLVWLHVLHHIQDRRSKLFLCWIMLFLSANIYFVYYVFREQQLENWWVWSFYFVLIGLILCVCSLYFSAPFLPLDLWNVLWCICVTGECVCVSVCLCVL